MLLPHANGGGRAGLPDLREPGLLHLHRAGKGRAIAMLPLQPRHLPARLQAHRAGASSGAGRRRPSFAYTDFSSDSTSCPPFLPCKGAQGCLPVQGKERSQGQDQLVASLLPLCELKTFLSLLSFRWFYSSSKHSGALLSQPSSVFCVWVVWSRKGIWVWENQIDLWAGSSGRKEGRVPVCGLACYLR